MWSKLTSLQSSPPSRKTSRGLDASHKFRSTKTLPKASSLFRVTWLTPRKRNGPQQPLLKPTSWPSTSNYFLLRWIRCTYSPNYFETWIAFLEVLSWYDSSGMRPFAFMTTVNTLLSTINAVASRSWDRLVLLLGRVLRVTRVMVSSRGIESGGL